jgi:dTDP-4-amino-4,6-dideoxygalactose transaminase
MIGLIPAEYWEYSLFDAFRSLIPALLPLKRPGTMHLEGIGNCIPARSARAAIVLALKSLNLPSTASIGVPLYSCPVVFKAIKTAGYTPVFIDIDPSNYCISVEDLAKKSSSIDAVIAIHLFGHLCDIPRIREVIQSKPVIEDCAQSIGSKLGGRTTGSMGDIAAFSFRSGKYLSVGEGGAIFSSDPGIHSGLVQRSSALPAPGFADELKHIAVTFIRTSLRRKPLWGLVGSRIWSNYNKTVKHSEQSPLVLEQTYNTDRRLTQYKLKFLEAAIAAQRGNADYYTQNLHVDATMISMEKKGTFLNRYLYPILFPSSKARDYVADFLFNQRIGSIKPYQNIAEIATEHYGYSGECPIAESISKRILAIPVYSSLSKKTLMRIAECINCAWGQVAKGGIPSHD